MELTAKCVVVGNLQFFSAKILLWMWQWFFLFSRVFFVRMTMRIDKRLWIFWREMCFMLNFWFVSLFSILWNLIKSKQNWLINFKNCLCVPKFTALPENLPRQSPNQDWITRPKSAQHDFLLLFFKAFQRGSKKEQQTKDTAKKTTKEMFLFFRLCGYSHFYLCF